MAALKATFIVVCVAVVLQRSAGFSKTGHHIFDKFAALANIKYPTTTARPPRPDPITIITFPTYTDTNPTLIDTPTASTDNLAPTVIDTPIDTTTNDDAAPDPNGTDGADGADTPTNTAIDTSVDTPVNAAVNAAVNAPVNVPAAVVPAPNTNNGNTGNRALNGLRFYYDNDEEDESDNDIIELDELDLSEGRATSAQRPNNKKKRNRRRQQQIKFNRQQQNKSRRRQSQRRRQALLNQVRRDERQRLLRIINLLNQSSQTPLKIRIRRIPNRLPPQYFSPN